MKALTRAYSFRTALALIVALLLSGAAIGNAHAAPITRTDRSVQPNITNGGCNTDYSQNIPIHVGACINYTSGNNHVNADAYIGPQSSANKSLWRSCTAQIDLVVQNKYVGSGKSNWITESGGQFNCLPPLQCPCQYHYNGPSVQDQSSQEYYSMVFWTANYNGTVIQGLVDSPTQYG